MEMSMRTLSLAASLVLAGCCAVETTAPVTEVADSQQWLEPAPTASSRAGWEEIAVSRFFEVSASKLFAAENRLASVSFLPQEANAVAYYGGREFKCDPPERAYLVRAMYANGGTGAFTLNWDGSSLIVEHLSLGHAGTLYRSALIACLARAPDAVYSVVSGAL
jgi:hypothetical protein